jgi:hypothetical protein
MTRKMRDDMHRGMMEMQIVDAMKSLLCSIQNDNLRRRSLSSHIESSRRSDRAVVFNHENNAA